MNLKQNESNIFLDIIAVVYQFWFDAEPTAIFKWREPWQ